MRIQVLHYEPIDTGHIQYRRKLALLPIRLTNGDVVWLERVVVREEQRMVSSKYVGYLHMYWVRTGAWRTMSDAFSRDARGPSGDTRRAWADAAMAWPQESQDKASAAERRLPPMGRVGLFT